MNLDAWLQPLIDPEVEAYVRSLVNAVLHHSPIEASERADKKSSLVAVAPMILGNMSSVMTRLRA